jgi:hypothetical protein
MGVLVEELTEKTSFTVLPDRVDHGNPFSQLDER